MMCGRLSSGHFLPFRQFHPSCEVIAAPSTRSPPALREHHPGLAPTTIAPHDVWAVACCPHRPRPAILQGYYPSTGVREPDGGVGRPQLDCYLSRHQRPNSQDSDPWCIGRGSSRDDGIRDGVGLGCWILYVVDGLLYCFHGALYPLPIPHGTPCLASFPVCLSRTEGVCIHAGYCC